jgi:hypothetical protein
MQKPVRPRALAPTPRRAHPPPADASTLRHAIKHGLPRKCDPRRAQIRPFFGTAWAKFSEVNVPVADVGKKIGGKVEQNIKSGVFQNACPIRMSYVLNYTGVPIPRSSYAVVSGADGKWYMYRVNDMMSFLETRDLLGHVSPARGPGQRNVHAKPVTSFRE